MAGAALLLSACSSSSTGKGSTASTAGAASTAGSSAPPSTSAPSTSAKPAPPAKKVHVSGYPDGSTVGVGMPIIATFNRKITSGVEFAKHVTVTVNGKPVTTGGWYFEKSDPKSGHRMEAHYRLPDFWPAHAHVHVAFHLKGVSAGTGLAFDGKLSSLDFDTGPRNIGVVDEGSHTLTITSDGKQYGRFPVSLGATKTPTFRGTKVIMEQVPTTCMHDTNGTYYECGIKWDQRLTYSGEYLHSAPWNVHNIGHFDSSNGCTNLLPSDAVKLYHFLRIGDVVEYPNANGPAMSMGAGYGDWNVPWVQWQTGGAVAVS
jgi:lipoprotein-anchoring transpeptidase ErfK/SrfK